MWQMEQAQRCPSCGTFDWEWTEDPSAWSAGIYPCPGCRSVELKSQTFKDAAHPEGWKLRLYRGGEEPDGDSI